jgi:hypothetical protein
VHLLMVDADLRYQRCYVRHESPQHDHGPVPGGLAAVEGRQGDEDPADDAEGRTWM